MKMTIGKINFGAGPAMLPPEVLHEMAKSVLRYKKTGYSILELPHRSKEFKAILEEANSLVMELCQLTHDFEVLWMHGGGRAQFAMIPMNFLAKGDVGGYIDSGHWAHEAIESAHQAAHKVNVVASSKKDNYNYFPLLPAELPNGLKYLHLTTNNTIYGTQCHQIPGVGVPIIADMSSDILSGSRDYLQFAMFYAVAQKNLGTPGVTLVAINKELLYSCAENIPSVFSYAQQVKEKNLLNTPNVSGIYTSLLMLRWIKAKGMDNIEKANMEKAKLLYDSIDNSSAFIPHVTQKAGRSTMNVVFTASDAVIEKKFIDLCRQNDIVGIEGHRSVGGYRVSLYNAVSIDDVKTLAEVIGNM